MTTPARPAASHSSSVSITRRRGTASTARSIGPAAPIDGAHGSPITWS